MKHAVPSPFAAAALVAFSLLAPSCVFDTGVRGSGNVVEETRNVAPFEAVEAGGRFHVVLTQGPAGPLRLQGEDNILPRIRAEVRNGTLKLHSRDKLGRIEPIVVHASSPTLTRAELSGAGKLRTEGTVTGEALKLSISGAGSIDADLAVERLDVAISGAGEARLRGSARVFSFSASGAGELEARALRCQDVDVSISGAGSATVNASGTLKADISGAGSVRYAGQPAVVEQDVSGAGSVRALDPS